MDYMAAIREFHEAFAVDRTFCSDLLVLRQRLIKEEAEEVLDALDTLKAFCDHGVTAGSASLVERFRDLAKELADLLVVTFGTADALGIPMDEVFAEVHRSNMSKLGDDGKPIRRDDGKVLKGPNYRPADLSFIK